MRNFIFCLLMAMGVSLSTFAQETTYSTTLSDPDVVYPGYISLNAMTVDVGFDNLSGASLWSVGVDMLYPINEKIRVEALAIISLLSLEKDGLPFLLSTGAEYSLSSKTKAKQVPVLLSFNWDTDYIKGTETQTWSSVKLPAHVKYDLVARAGLYTRHSALEYEEGFTTYDITGLTHAGIYAGVGYTMSSYLNAVTSDGYEFAAGRMIRPYFDIMILPTSVDLTSGGSQVKTVKENLGWRLGTVLVSKPFTRSENFDRKIMRLGDFAFRLDVGNRPFEGFFITTGISYSLKKFK